MKKAILLVVALLSVDVGAREVSDKEARRAATEARVRAARKAYFAKLAADFKDKAEFDKIAGELSTAAEDLNKAEEKVTIAQARVDALMPADEDEEITPELQRQIDSATALVEGANANLEALQDKIALNRARFDELKTKKPARENPDDTTAKADAVKRELDTLRLDSAWDKVELDGLDIEEQLNEVEKELDQKTSAVYLREKLRRFALEVGCNLPKICNLDANERAKALDPYMDKMFYNSKGELKRTRGERTDPAHRE